jgi:hypothetical protein
VAAYHGAVDADVAMFRPRPDVGLGRRWHVLAQRLHGFALVAPSPCGFIQAEIQCERTMTTRAKLATADRAVLERRCCRHCLEAVRSGRRQR